MHAFVKIWLTEPIQSLIKNAHGHLETLEDAIIFVPHEANYEDSYVASPYAGLISYSRDEIKHNAPQVVYWLLVPLFVVFGFLCKWGKLNQVIHLYNYVQSTNLIPSLKKEKITQIYGSIREKYPRHAILVRNLFREFHPDWFALAKAQGHAVIPSRMMYFYSEKFSPPYIKVKNTRNDLALLQRTTLGKVEHHEFSDTDFARMEELFEFQYVKKYSKYNPQFTATLFKKYHQDRAVEFFGLRNSQGELEGFIGTLFMEETLTVPCMGYRTDAPKDLNLYRILIAYVLKKAWDEKKFLNLSSGVSQFKKLRGASAHVEYSIVAYRHLRGPAFWLFWTIDLIMRNIAEPILKKNF